MRNRNNDHSPPEDVLRQLALHPSVFGRKFKQQAAAVCFRRTGSVPEVLLITSRETGRWVIPKGGAMKGRTLAEAAAIEAWEEAGVRGNPGHEPIGNFTYLKRLANGRFVPCVVAVYPIEVLSMDEDYRERGQRRLEWVSAIEASNRVREPELKSIFVAMAENSQFHALCDTAASAPCPVPITP